MVNETLLFKSSEECSGYSGRPSSSVHRFCEEVHQEAALVASFLQECQGLSVEDRVGDKLGSLYAEVRDHLTKGLVAPWISSVRTD